MPFFEYCQNNSGGDFDFDPESGISRIVIVEADSSDEADEIAEAIGLYFDGNGDCPCCGYRWHPAGQSDKVPSHYGTPIQDVAFGEGLNWKWIKEGPEAYVHFKDGTLQGYGLPLKEIG